MRERKIVNIEKTTPDAIVADMLGSSSGSPRASQSRSRMPIEHLGRTTGGSAQMAMEHRGMVESGVPDRSAVMSSASPHGSSRRPMIQAMP
ncbi:hypothetical protein PQJ75_18140 [Rhodoplanes sp. TEM]|uniref:Uncharacterized protein n=1 Tax=Rhodoplanes tepidamans TaxID=200616 RepID=A0ABT5JJQ9_RHOTP|nr:MULTISPECIES: hypothetical protein [Rhodoplanes]MDC7789591.1 hypothetical protein [Rhodoplanes tepidamans]MDC7985655.1 hypothetical protein [Rhodoplanes sp. TEM]MDQ0357265.1 hypothetical protein [Rhodoplanes tepidamans]